MVSPASVSIIQFAATACCSILNTKSPTRQTESPANSTSPVTSKASRTSWLGVTAPPYVPATPIDHQLQSHFSRDPGDFGNLSRCSGRIWLSDVRSPVTGLQPPASRNTRRRGCRMPATRQACGLPLIATQCCCQDHRSTRRHRTLGLQKGSPHPRQPTVAARTTSRHQGTGLGVCKRVVPFHKDTATSNRGELCRSNRSGPSQTPLRITQPGRCG